MSRPMGVLPSRCLLRGGLQLDPFGAPHTPGAVSLPFSTGLSVPTAARATFGGQPARRAWLRKQSGVERRGDPQWPPSRPPGCNRLGSFRSNGASAAGAALRTAGNCGICSSKLGRGAWGSRETGSRAGQKQNRETCRIRSLGLSGMGKGEPALGSEPCS